MAEITYERPDGAVRERTVDELNYDEESGHWLLLSEDDRDLLYIPRERVYAVREAQASVESDRGPEEQGGW
ncbi:MAG: hypothetical protein ABEJ76_07300 [Halanaeroarchaeum sp.]